VSQRASLGEEVNHVRRSCPLIHHYPPHENRRHAGYDEADRRHRPAPILWAETSALARPVLMRAETTWSSRRRAPTRERNP